MKSRMGERGGEDRGHATEGIKWTVFLQNCAENLKMSWEAVLGARLLAGSSQRALSVPQGSFGDTAEGFWPGSLCFLAAVAIWAIFCFIQF